MGASNGNVTPLDKPHLLTSHSLQHINIVNISSSFIGAQRTNSRHYILEFLLEVFVRREQSFTLQKHYSVRDICSAHLQPHFIIKDLNSK